LACMDAVDLGFADRFFDCVICIQNGISAFHVEPARLVRESIRIAKDGGRIFFSSYSEKFWEHRLEWFEMQSEQGLLGEIDRSATGNGRIVCRDGFTATTFSANDFDALLMDFSVRYSIHEVDQSSIFCEIKV
ncbi:MAG: methyltransferase domain-containing protein, partial [Candidatus Zixiibacteriota bacterium]